MGMPAILFNGAETFDQIVIIPSTEGPKWNIMKIVRGFRKEDV